MIYCLSELSPGEEVKLEREVPPAGGTVVEVRRDVCVTLRFDMAKISRRTSIEYAGLKIPLTPSVKRRESTQVHKLLGLRMFVFGTTSGRQYGLICDDCQKKENQPGSPSLVDFRSNSDVILPLRNSDDKSIRISFSFHCYPTHYKNGDSQYRYVIRLGYSSKGHSLSLAWKCCYVDKSHLLLDIASHILSISLRNGPEIWHLLHRRPSRPAQSASPCLRPALRIRWMGKTPLSRERTPAVGQLLEG